MNSFPILLQIHFLVFRFLQKGIRIRIHIKDISSLLNNSGIVFRSLLASQNLDIS